MIDAKIDICRPGFDSGTMVERRGQLLVEEWQARYDPEYMARRRAEEWAARTSAPAYHLRTHENSQRYHRRMSHIMRHATAPPAVGIWPSDPVQNNNALITVREDPLPEHFNELFGLPLDRVTEKPLAAQLFEQLEELAAVAAQTDWSTARKARRGEPYSLPQLKVGQREMVVDFAPMPSGSQVFTMRYADRPEAPEGFHLVKKEDNSFLVTAAEMHNLPVLHRPLTLLRGAGAYISEYQQAFEEQQSGERLRDVILDSLFSGKGRKAAAVLLLSQSFGFLMSDNLTVMMDHEGSRLGTLPTNAEVIEIGEMASQIGAYTNMDSSITELEPMSADNVVLAREGESTRLDLSGDDGVLEVDECIEMRAEIPDKDGLRFASSREMSLSANVDRLQVSICNTGSVALRGDLLKTVFVQRARHDDLPFPLSHFI